MNDECPVPDSSVTLRMRTLESMRLELPEDHPRMPQINTMLQMFADNERRYRQTGEKLRAAYATIEKLMMEELADEELKRREEDGNP